MRPIEKSNFPFAQMGPRQRKGWTSIGHQLRVQDDGRGHNEGRGGGVEEVFRFVVSRTEIKRASTRKCTFQMQQPVQNMEDGYKTLFCHNFTYAIYDVLDYLDYRFLGITQFMWPSHTCPVSTAQSNQDNGSPIKFF